MSKLEVVNSSNFEEKVINSKKPVLVDFFATWCGPCKMLSPILESVAEESDEYEVFKVNIDDDMDLARQYGIMSVPTMIIFKDGKQVDKLIGLRQKNQLVASLKV